MKYLTKKLGNSLNHPGCISGSHRFYKGFTLIEILVVVLIIGVLGAIALPQYQRALLKSRYAALMPIAKSMAESNEVYYLEHGDYADNAQDLPVQGRMNYPDGTELEFGTSSDYAYVLASNPSVEHNTYVVYQKHSKNFADTTQCEAFTTDEQANQICQSFGGTPLDGSLGGEDYTAYLLSGNGNGTFEKECKGPFATEKECPSGCGIMTRDSAECNTATGQWNDDGFDEEDCPKPLGTDTDDCPEGYLPGTRTREGNVCKNGVYTWGNWSNTCQEDPCYGATTCDNNVPTACEDGFYLYNNKCNACYEGALTCRYTTCSSSGSRYLTDTSCKNGYYMSTGGSNACPRRNCTSCGAHALSCTVNSTNSVTIKECEAGYCHGTGYGTGCNSYCSSLGAGTLTCSVDCLDATSCASGYRLGTKNVGGHYRGRCYAN